MKKFISLKPGDEIRVIAPARSIKLIGETNINLAIKKLESMGFKISFGKHVYDVENRMSASIKHRVDDFHEAFADENVKAVLTVIGGFNSHQLLPYINWNLVKNNPKVFCGFSDITSLHLSILKRANIPVFYGPHFSSFAMTRNSEYIEKQFKNMFMSENRVIELEASKLWSDDLWFLDQENRQFFENTGWWNIQSGEAEGKIIGGNLSTIILINGTDNFPDINEDTILAIEDVDSCDYDNFERMLVSLIQSPWFKYVRGLMIGRFCLNSKITFEDLNIMLKNKPELKNIPILANLDFGHTMPLCTLPLGLNAKMIVNEQELKVTIEK